MSVVMVVAPHPDDETLGCGGTLLKHKAGGDAVHWLIVTGMSRESGHPAHLTSAREKEIGRVARAYGFASFHKCNLPATRLDTLAIADIIDALGSYFRKVQPGIVYLPWGGDVHTDHRIVFDAAFACTKWFRYGSVRRILTYETLSETEFAAGSSFSPNVFIDMTPYLEKKIRIMKRYSGETGEFPFPRSDEAIRALALLHGANAGCGAAEAFMLLKEIL